MTWTTDVKKILRGLATQDEHPIPRTLRAEIMRVLGSRRKKSKMAMLQDLKNRALDEYLARASVDAIAELPFLEERETPGAATSASATRPHFRGFTALNSIEPSAGSDEPEPMRVIERPSGITVRVFRAMPGTYLEDIARYHANHREHRIVIAFRQKGEASAEKPKWMPMTEFLEQDGKVFWNKSGELVEVDVVSWFSQTVRVAGSCDTVSKRFVIMGAFKILTLKATHNNCLVAAFAFQFKDKRKHKIIVRDLALSMGPKTNEDIEKLCEHYHCYARVWRPSQRITKPMLEFGAKDRPVINLLFSNGHYYYVFSGAPAAGILAYIKAEETYVEIATRERKLAQLAETIQDTGSNDFSEIARTVANSQDNWLIDGGAGCGKTTLAQQIAALIGKNKIVLTATTGIAASRIGGITIDKFLLRHNNKPGKLRCNTILIDEISMCDARKMDIIVGFCQRQNLRVILVGDVMQLGPVNKLAGWFFQSDNLAVLHLHRVALTKVRRTTDIEYANLCSRFRVGKPTPADIEFMSSKYVADADPKNYSLFVASKNAVVDAHNARIYAEKEGPATIYAPRFACQYNHTLPADLPAPPATEQSEHEIAAKILKVNQRRTISLKVGVRVLAMKNGDGFANGMLGEVLECTAAGVRVKFDDQPEPVLVGWMSNDHSKMKGMQRHEKAIKYCWIPLHLGYALTVHKSQGGTIRASMLFDASNCFDSGMYYTAITRVSDPSLLTITGRFRQPRIGDYKPSEIALKFLNGERIPTISEMIADSEEDQEGQFKTGIEGEPIACDEKSSSEPCEAIFFDFETAEQTEFRTEPYFCTATLNVMDEESKTLKETRKFVMSDIPGAPMGSCDIRPETGKPIPVVEKIVCEILQMAKRFEGDIKRRLKGAKAASGGDGEFKKRAKDVRTYANLHCPRFAAYNGAGFDNYYVAQALINGPWLDEKYRPKFIFKGSQMVGFSIMSPDTLCTILKSHDLYQILFPMSLKSACKAFLPKNDPSNAKIDFHAQIMDISSKRFKKWANWTWDDFKSKPQKIRVEQYPECVSHSIDRKYKVAKQWYRPADVLEYAIRDTDVLSKLYNAVDKLFREIIHVSVWSFLTIASSSWYGGLLAAKKVIGVQTDEKLRHCRKNKSLKLFSVNHQQDSFIRRGVYGGRACPRIIYPSAKTPAGGYVYVDISAMYGSIMLNARLPCGVISWVSDEQIPNYIDQIKDYARENTLKSMKFEMPTYWIAEIDFQERVSSLEPVLSEKTKSGTRYTVERRTAVMTSLDLAMILIKGGTYFGCKRMLHFADGEKWSHPWAESCLKGKNENKTSNPPLSTMYKLMLNAFYGSMLRKDHTDEFMVVSRPEETMEFLSKYEWNYAISTQGKYDVMYGEPKDVEESFLTTRPTYAGAFVLAYSRMMVQQICAIVNPTEDPCLQPVNGDTDSLLIPVEAAQRLRDAGWLPKDGAKPGQLTDELLETLTKTSGLELHPDRSKYDGSKFALVSRWYYPAPKVGCCEFIDPITAKKAYKFRAKGISVNSKQDGELMSSAILFDHCERYFKPILESGGCTLGLTMKLPSGLKRIGPGSVPQDDRNHSKTLLSIMTTQLSRNVLTHRWEGRKYIGDGITVPWGWVANASK